jgi:hypothetical protein
MKENTRIQISTKPFNDNTAVLRSSNLKVNFVMSPGGLKLN